MMSGHLPRPGSGVHGAAMNHGCEPVSGFLIVFPFLHSLMLETLEFMVAVLGIHFSNVYVPFAS